jgi:hypothetical protein
MKKINWIIFQQIFLSLGSIATIALLLLIGNKIIINFELSLYTIAIILVYIFAIISCIVFLISFFKYIIELDNDAANYIKEHNEIKFSKFILFMYKNPLIKKEVK